MQLQLSNIILKLINQMQKTDNYLIMTLKQTLSELERKFMPQIAHEEHDDVISLLNSEGIKTEKVQLNPNTIRHSQSKVNKDKVRNIIKDIRNKKPMPPIFISSDNAIIDGHHRWIAFKILKTPIKCIKIGLPQKEAIIKFKEIEGQLTEDVKKTSNFITVFHGTMPKKLSKIKSSGLQSTNGYGQGWYMVATDFESALYHATPDEDGGNVVVIEFNIPTEENDRWEGYPYLWKGYERNSNSTWYALKEELPSKFIKKVHTIPNDKWIGQKNKGY